MATLSDTPLLIPEMLLFPNGLSQIMETVVETQRQVAENLIFPMQQMHEAIVSMVEPILEAQRTIASSPFIKMVGEIQEANKRMIELMTFRSIPPYFGQADVIDGEIEEKEEINSPRQLETALIPQPTFMPETTALLLSGRTRSKMGLKQISGGNFSYKRKALVGLSSRNREGQLLGIMLENPDIFVSNELIDKKFYTYDTLGRSDLIKLLKNKFKLNKLEAIIRRQGEGYILISINPTYIN